MVRLFFSTILIFSCLTGPQASVGLATEWDEVKGLVLDCDSRQAKDERYGFVYDCIDTHGKHLKVQNSYAEGFSGTVREYNKEGNLLSIKRFKNTKPEGVQEEYFPNGSLKFKQTFANGVENGDHAYYSQPGIPWEISIYAAGKIIEKKDYFSSGKFGP